jgi:hypothetical protein
MPVTTIRESNVARRDGRHRRSVRLCDLELVVRIRVGVFDARLEARRERRRGAVADPDGNSLGMTAARIRGEAERRRLDELQARDLVRGARRDRPDEQHTNDQDRERAHGTHRINDAISLSGA